MKKKQFYCLRHLILLTFFLVLLMMIGCVEFISPTLTPILPFEIEEIIQPGPTEGKDADVYSGQPTNNFGNRGILRIGTYHITSHFYRAYLQFDLSCIPQYATITEAKLGLYEFGMYTNLGPYVSVHRVNGSWEEDNISWHYQPAFSEEAVDSQMACGDEKFHFWDITNLVKGWVNGAIENHGVMLKHAGWGGNIYYFYSSEYTSPNPRPKLIIKYYTML